MYVNVYMYTPNINIYVLYLFSFFYIIIKPFYATHFISQYVYYKYYKLITLFVFV